MLAIFDWSQRQPLDPPPCVIRARFATQFVQVVVLQAVRRQGNVVAYTNHLIILSPCFFGWQCKACDGELLPQRSKFERVVEIEYECLARPFVPVRVGTGFAQSGPRLDGSDIRNVPLVVRTLAQHS